MNRSSGTKQTLSRDFLHRMMLVIILLALVTLAKAGGPKYIVGTSYFTSANPGQPITWANGTVTYYTDQGNLSPLLNGAAADNFVANAFALWTAPPSVALVAVHGGQLGEDVSGQNVIRNPDGSITMPTDIQPTATGKPVGVVYDYDGTVTDALLGAGAGDSDLCFTNAVFGGPDAFAVTGNFAHALIVLNGNCIQQSSDLLEAKYRLMRVLGTVLGLDWSQLNLNVITGVPSHPTAEDQAGFPLMHATDPNVCVPITLCYPDPADLKMDDRAAISRLYPVTSTNAAQFPGKSVLASNTARIYGKVMFTDSSGNSTSGMQAVNVVARWIDPSTGLPSGQYAASSVSGFLFRGNSGSTITGSINPAGVAYSQFGSTDTSLEGFFDLGGLELPSGAGQYQISVEAIDPMWSQDVGPYEPNQVTPSGSFTPVVVNTAPGTNSEQDAPMLGCAMPMQSDSGNLGWNSPLPAPATGRWCGDLQAYGDVDYFWMNAQPNRTMTIDITAVDETETPSVLKARPMIGMWSLSDSQGSAPEVASLLPFSGTQVGTTRLSAQVLTSGPLRIGVADLRGDGRPDFTYVGRILYGDSATPTRLSVRGGTPINLQGLGFEPGMTVSVGNTGTSVLALFPSQIVAAAPALPDGVQSVTISDPGDGGYSSLTNVITFGAAATDTMNLTGSNSPVAVGGETPNAIRVSVHAADGVTPVDGATVVWSVNNNATLSICGASVCTAITDESGHTETRVTVGAPGTTTLTAQLAPAAYPNKQVQATIASATASTSISLLPMKIWGTQGMSLNVPVSARLLTSAGAPVSGQVLNFTVTAGSGTMSPSAVTTGADGYAHSTLQVSSLNGEVDVVVCAASGGIVCQTLNLFQVSPSAIQLQPVLGAQQGITVGQSFTPLQVRALDSSTPPNPVFGVPIVFATTLLLPTGQGAGGGGSEPIGHNPQRVIVGSSTSVVSSDSDGYAAIIPSNGNGTRPLEVDVAATPAAGGSAAALQFQLEIYPPLAQADPAGRNRPGP